MMRGRFDLPPQACQTPYAEVDGGHVTEFLASIDEAEASLVRGEGRPVTPGSMQALAEDVKRRGADAPVLRLSDKRSRQWDTSVLHRLIPL